MSWWRRLFRTPKPSPQEAAMRAALQAYFAREVASGYQTPEEMLTGAVEYLGDEYEAEALARLAPPLLKESLQTHLQAQQSWPAETDFDRLQAAFAEANRRGIVARDNFTCCQTCGHHEIGEEIEGAEQQGVKVRGYVFFHQQDTEAAVNGGGLYLAYGTVAEEAQTAIAREMTDILDRHHLATDWDGTAGQRIFVKLAWHRRWPHTV